jgi:hypothetical protein
MWAGIRKSFAMGFTAALAVLLLPATAFAQMFEEPNQRSDIVPQMRADDGRSAMQSGAGRRQVAGICPASLAARAPWAKRGLGRPLPG